MKTLTYIAAIALLSFSTACKDKEKVIETAVGVDTAKVDPTPVLPVAEELVEGMESNMDHPIPDSHKMGGGEKEDSLVFSICLLYTSPSPRDRTRSRMPSSA